jgi:hypothetical protein
MKILHEEHQQRRGFPFLILRLVLAWLPGRPHAGARPPDPSHLPAHLKRDIGIDGPETDTRI